MVQYLLIVAGTECDPSFLSAVVINPAAIVRTVLAGLLKSGEILQKTPMGEGEGSPPRKELLTNRPKAIG